MQVTACLVTRGNVDLEPVLRSLPENWPVVIYDNSARPADHGVYGRYIAIAEAETDVVYVQDDDCMLPPWSHAELVANYKPGVLTANMPERFRAHYDDSCLVGFGAIFDRSLPTETFARMSSIPPDFDRTCDVYFTALALKPPRWLDLQYEDLPWATGDDRMYRQPGHVGERRVALERARDMR